MKRKTSRKRRSVKRKTSRKRRSVKRKTSRKRRSVKRKGNKKLKFRITDEERVKIAALSEDDPEAQNGDDAMYKLSDLSDK